MKCLVVCLAVVLLPLAVVALTFQEDDLVFDDVGKDTSVPSVNDVVEEPRGEDRPRDSKGRREDKVVTRPPVRQRERKKAHGADKSRNMPVDVTAVVGHVFKLKIPKHFFEGNREHYKVREKRLPQWLHWDDAASTVVGVPSKRDMGKHKMTFTLAKKQGQLVTKVFVVRVVAEKRDDKSHGEGKFRCNDDDDKIVLSFVLNVRFEDIKPQVKVNAIENLAGFFGVHTNSLTMQPQSSKDYNRDLANFSLSNSNNGKRHNDRHLTSIQWQIGCNHNIWKHQTELIKHIPEQQRDGTIAEVLQLPFLFCRVKTVYSTSLSRNRREIGSGFNGNGDGDEEATFGSGDSSEYDYNDYDEDDEDDDEDDEDPTGLGIDGTTLIDDKGPQRPIASGSTGTRFNTETNEHPHRHHHGEGTIMSNGEVFDEQNNIDRNYPVNGSSVTEDTTTSTTTLPETPAPSVPSTSSLSPSTRASTVTSDSSSFANTIEASTVTATSAISSSSTASTTQQPKLDTIVELTEKSKRPDTEPVTLLPTVPYEHTTMPSLTAIAQPSTTTDATTATITSDRSDLRTTSFADNVTTEEFTDKSSTNITRDDVSRITTPYSEVPVTTSVTIPVTKTTIEQHTIPLFNSTTVTMTTSVPPMISTTVLPKTLVNATMSTTTVSTTTVTPSTNTSTTTQSTIRPTTIIYTTTEKIEYVDHNFPPRQDRRLKKIAVTAGKPLSYIIPADTFSDLEDGDTRKLRLSLYLQGSPIKKNHWLQFNQDTQEIYGLPLENSVSTWNYELVASDSEGLNVSDKLDIHVQQHKLSRTVNHEFSIYLKIENKHEFRSNVDWELKVMRGLAELYGDHDTTHITVRSIEVTQDQAIFTWTNDSIPRGSECPKNEIDALHSVLVAKDKDNRPSLSLQKILSPDIRVDRVLYQGIGQCDEIIRSQVPKATQQPEYNVPPTSRNQVDHINVTVGQLLVYRVPDDTFYDKEDGSARNMKMSLLTVNRTPIAPDEWLQFDSKNQEFYGVPLHSDVGRKTYQLVVTDKDGASATDSLVVVVHPEPPYSPGVEFTMTLDILYESFAHSASQKRSFIEKIRDLYQDKDTSAISLHSIIRGSAIVTWRNITLPTGYCPETINKLRKVLVNDDKTLNDRVNMIMEPEFPVKQVTVTPLNACLGELTNVHSPDSYVPPIDDSTSVGATHDEYLVTFVLPAIIIAAMLILAGIIACILYKRRRSGKMSVSEQDDERQSFRSKGIPVIFQDELDEKPDPGNKSPVILKEEKPPLPPPEYQKTEDGADVPMLPKENSEEPYQPPPPFATNRENNRQNRPKPTPTYRKPPPYVPP